MDIKKFKETVKSCNTFLIIGAEKANYVDDFYLNAIDIKYCVLVEPIPGNVELLNDKFKDNDNYQIIHCAITPECGMFEMITPIDLNDNLCGSSSLIMNERNNIRRELEKKNSKMNFVEVEGRTIESIKQELKTTVFDYIQIDTEGNDREIFFQIIDNDIKFKNIMVETMWLKGDEKNDLHKKLSEMNCIYYDDGANTYASCK